MFVYGAFHLLRLIEGRDLCQQDTATLAPDLLKQPAVGFRQALIDYHMPFYEKLRAYRLKPTA